MEILLINNIGIHYRIVLDVYTFNEAFKMQINEQLKFETDVVYYENEQWVINCIQSKFNKYFEKFGNNITKIYKTSYARKKI